MSYYLYETTNDSRAQYTVRIPLKVAQVIEQMAVDGGFTHGNHLIASILCEIARDEAPELFANDLTNQSARSQDLHP